MQRWGQAQGGPGGGDFDDLTSLNLPSDFDVNIFSLQVNSGLTLDHVVCAGRFRPSTRCLDSTRQQYGWHPASSLYYKFGRALL
jgi:hypothetical protein